MFTGIIRDIGTIQTIEDRGEQVRLTVTSSKTPKEAQIGSSISNSGICLTVVELNEESFAFDVMPQTMRLTALGSYKEGDRLNLEGSMRVGDEVGGHFLYGHVDGVATVTGIKKEADAVIVTLEPPNHLMKYLAPQGSVALDGVSLTVAVLREHDFDVSLIEHTMQETTLSERKVGDGLNMEVDMMMKYLERLVEAKG